MKSTKAFTIDDDLWKEFKKYCIDKNVSISSEIENLIRGVLEDAKR